MKRILSIMLCVAMVIAMPIVSYASIDLSAMTYDELLEIREEIELAIEKINNEKNEEQSNSPTSQPDENGIYPLEIKEYGYGIVNDKWLYYGFIAYNPNKDVAHYYPTFRITARDEDGIIIGTKDQTCTIVYPQQYIAHGFQAFEITEIPSSFSIEALKPDFYNIKKVGTLENPDYLPLEVVNYVKRDDKIVGEISNPNSYDIGMAALTTIYRDANGAICGGNSTFVSNVNANSKAPFEIRVSKEFSACSYELYAGLW